MAHYRCAIFVVLFSTLFAQVPAADPPKAKDSDLVAAVRKAAETAEVHGVGVSGPRHFRLEGVTEFPSLLTALRDKNKKGAVLRVWEQFGPDAKKVSLDDKYFSELDNVSSALGSQLKSSVSGEIEKILGNPDFYSEEVFSKSFLLTEEMKRLAALGKTRPLSDTVRLNWWLLERTFRVSMPEMPKHFRTVRVQVVQGSDVILVLSSSDFCRWEVKLFEGAKVTGVILCGSKGQEITGVDAPVVYRARYAPDNVTVVNLDNLCAYDTESEKYTALVAGIKKITGKDFTTFTTPSEKNAHRPDSNDEPFTIRPKGK